MHRCGSNSQLVFDARSVPQKHRELTEAMEVLIWEWVKLPMKLPYDLGKKHPAIPAMT